jgi:hypothetical protein
VTLSYKVAQVADLSSRLDSANRPMFFRKLLSGGGAKSTPMTGEAAARIQAAEAKQGTGGVEKGGFASRAQGAAARNEAGNKSK